VLTVDQVRQLSRDIGVKFASDLQRGPVAHLPVVRELFTTGAWYLL